MLAWRSAPTAVAVPARCPHPFKRYHSSVLPRFNWDRVMPSVLATRIRLWRALPLCSSSAPLPPESLSAVSYARSSFLLLCRFQ